MRAPAWVVAGPPRSHLKEFPGNFRPVTIQQLYKVQYTVIFNRWLHAQLLSSTLDWREDAMSSVHFQSKPKAKRISQFAPKILMRITEQKGYFQRGIITG